MLPLHSPSISPWLSRWEWNLKGRDTVSNLLCSHPPSGPPRVLFYWHHCIETWQANLKPPPPTFYHSPLLASCPGDVTRHMVFSSIKPEKRFSQRREKVSEGVGLERRAGQRRKTKAQLFLLRVEGGEDSGKGGGDGCTVWGEWGESEQQRAPCAAQTQIGLALAQKRLHSR